MKLEFITLTLKNFLSFGNVEQTVTLNNNPYTVITGFNKDISNDDSGNKNGCGKAQPLYSKVLTDKGWKRMGDLTTETKVVTPKGNLAQILGIYYKGEKDIYRVHFKDGRYTDCCNEHLWKIWTGIGAHKVTGNNKQWYWDVVDTNTIIDYMNRGYKSFQKHIYVPLVEDVFIENDKKFIISPYIMGVLLGDGCISNGSCTFTSMDDEIIENVKHQLYEGYELTITDKNRKSKALTYRIVKKNRYENHFSKNIYHDELKRLGLWNYHSYDKFIPTEYMSLSKKQTLELLQGLFDTDGCIGKNGSVGFSTSSLQLAKDIQYLIWKLGGICKIREDRNYYMYNGVKKMGRNTYELSIRVKNPYRLVSLSRKKERCINYQYNDTLKNRIEKIEYVGKIPCQCIYIDDPEHLYVTDNFIVTHNTTIFNALHYALFGRAIGNKVTLPNLVNNINKKHMEVSLTFKKNDVLYKIERGRSPNYLRFYIGEKEITDESLGDSRDTQSLIEETIGMNEELFNQTIMLSCGVPIFMNQSTANQKLIIEQVLGVDVITNKINKLKEVIKETKNNINNEEFKISTLKSQQETLKNDYEKQISDYKLQKQNWYNTQESEIKSIEEQIDELKSIDYNKELRLINELKEYMDTLGKWQNNEKTKQGLISSINREQQMLETLNNQINTINSIDFDKELGIIKHNEEMLKQEEEYKNQLLIKQQIKNRYNELSNGYISLGNEKKKVQEKIEKYQSNLCPTCGQVLDKEKVEQEVNKLTFELQQYDIALHQVDVEIMETNSKLSDCVEEGKIFDYKQGRYSNIELLNIDKNKLAELNVSKTEIVGRINELNTELRAYDMEKPIEPSEYSQFMTINEYYESKSSMDVLNDKLNTVKTQVEPYSNLISDLETKLNSIEIVDETALKEMIDEQEHNNVLLKLLNAPNSYIRQSILDKSLTYLNTKIKTYLEQLGSTISVKFNSDMTIDMRRKGLDLGYVSSGEEGRIAIALTLAFRDTWESLTGIECNLLMVDELLDKIGLDVNGKQMMVSCLKHIPNRNTFLVSHDTEINNQSNRVITIVKEKEFSNIE